VSVKGRRQRAEGRSKTKYFCFYLLPSAFCLLPFLGCATSVHYDNLDFQNVPVTSDPSGARVVIDCGRGPNSMGNTPVMLHLVRRDPMCSMILSKPGFVDQRIDFHRSIMSAALLDLTTAAIAAGLAQVGRVSYYGSSGGTTDVSGSTLGYWTPVGVGVVVFSSAMLVDAGSGALWSHAPAEVHVTLKPATH
jgi:hypothetical protein